MARTIVIGPVARIEGHARVTIELDAAGGVQDARVQVAELRGFERLVAGRPVRELPALTARVCGICPVSHALAAARAGDLLLGAEPPPAARLLRELAQLGQLVESHATSFFWFAAPDLAELAPEARSFLGLAAAEPALARDGVLLRRAGQELIAALSGQRVHGPLAVPGGVTRPLDPAARDRLRAALPEALEAARRALEWWKERLPRHAAEAHACGEFESLFLALAGPGGRWALAEGALRLVGAHGQLLVDGADPAGYAALVGEAAEPWTRARRAFYRPMGYPAGLYRVGPLARLNAVSGFGTPLADRELRQFRALGRGAVLSCFHGHLARLVEIAGALERIGELLDDPAILGREVLAPAGAPRSEGVGACEAPRGTLFHHYRAGPDGLVEWGNLVVATGQNGLAMDRAIRQIAERWLEGTAITPALLGRVEAGLRAFDPCLSCATHAAGGRAVSLRLAGPGGETFDEA